MLCFTHDPDNDIRRTGMPEYLAPGVYVEETSFRSKSIEGVSTSTTGFVGPTCKGPTTGTPELLTSSGDFERIYGGYENLQFSGGEAINYIANAVKNYFDNGGSRLYVARVTTDRDEPGAEDYKAPLAALGAIEDISIVAAPGYSSFAANNRQDTQNALIAHAERSGAYRIAVLDTPRAQTSTAALEIKSRIDSSSAALYYPWVYVSNPLVQPGNKSIAQEILLPPSGFVCGIYARNDKTRGVNKTPANETVRCALRFETDIGPADHKLLNRNGINCLRFLPGRGNHLWGTRTTSSDPEWEYVGTRRYFIYLEHSIDRSTQWAVFENNGPQLWANVRETVSSFLYNEWVSGALPGASVDEAFFVRCDRTTMTQNDLENGRLICLIGVSTLKPAEFTVFRIGQKTADADS